MLYITGDLHGGATAYHITSKIFKPEKKNDKVICTGDFGGVWWHDYHTNIKHKRDEDYFLESKLRQRVEWLAVDGNHENFNRLFSDEFPLVTIYGGKAYKIRKNVYYLKRGEVFTIEGKTFFVFGGATSHDKEPFTYKTCYRTEHWKGRTEGIDWWKEEVPSESDISNAIANLNSVGWKVNHVITHTCPKRIKSSFPTNFVDGTQKEDKVEDILDSFIEKGLKFDFWHFGHFHIEKTIENYICHYEKIKQLDY